MTAFVFTAPPPNLNMLDAEFDLATEALVGDLPALAAYMETTAGIANTAATNASVAGAAAVAAANFRGAWSALTGALTVPASVSHAGTVWLLTVNVANVALETPGVSSAWVRSYPQRRIAILSASSLGRVPFGTNDQLHNVVAAPLLVAAAVCANSAHFVAASASSASSVAQSSDGRAWTLRTMPAAGIWHVVSNGSTMVAMRENASGSTATSRSTDGFITRTDFSFGDTWGSGLAGKVAGGGGNFISQLASGLVSVSVGNAPTVWSLGQTAPVTIVSAHVTTAGLFVVKATATSTYHTSTTGLTGSWTSRTLPGGCDTIVTDFDGALLAYVAGSLTAAVYRSTDGINWTSLVWAMPHASTAPRTINGVGIAGAVASGVACWTNHGGTAWVPRTSTLRLDATRQVASIGNVNVAVSGGLAYVLDASASDAGASTWE